MTANAQTFDAHFRDTTLRIDYTFAGDVHEQHIFVDQLHRSPHWYGRRSHLSQLPLQGNGQLTVCDAATRDTLYRHSFSTLFQEWLATDEAKLTSKSFENTFLIPYPKRPIDVTVELVDYHNHVSAKLTHTVRPDDILIERIGEHGLTPYEVIHAAEDTTRCIHVAFVAEGYTEAQMAEFMDDCRTAAASLFEHEPFKSLQQRFHIVAVKSASAESDVSEPAKGIWRTTAVASHFDTFYSDRYLTTLHLKQLHNLLAGIPYEHIVVLANTPHYGGGGIYNSYTLTSSRHRLFRPVVVHEFGHSFGGLADEYAYGESDPMYFADTEPWEPNLTTQHDFHSKWENLVTEGRAGLIEGGGYQSKGVWRAFENCRMRTNEEPAFCLVCQQALLRLIRFYTE